MSRRSLGGGGVGPCSPPSLCPWLTPTCISTSPTGSITLVSSPREISHYLHLKPSIWGNQRGERSHQHLQYNKYRHIVSSEQIHAYTHIYIPIKDGSSRCKL